MAVRSRSSLRVSMRQDTNDTSDNISLPQSNHPPPAKRPRLHPPSSRRRKSSPDLLDTTIENPPSSASKLTTTPRRSLTRRPPFLSSSASTTTSKPPDTKPLSKSLRTPHNPTSTSASATLYLNGGRESPDPLDTISPAPATVPKLARKLPPSKRTYAGHARRRVTQGSDSAPLPFKPTKTQSSPLSQAVTDSLGGELPQKPVPAPAVTASPPVPERRSLRSHDVGSRTKSELALYFPNYEDLVSLKPPKRESLASNTVVKLIDDLTTPPVPASAFSAPDADTPFGNPLLNLHNCETITLPDLSQESDESNEDPLNEDFYFKAHRRNERQEKQLRNIERDRAQHEKQQLDRLLDELQGQDWLRVMGINGVADTEKKLYEPKRDYFIKEISALLQKFKIWKEEEKRRKTAKDNNKPFTSFGSGNSAIHHNSTKSRAPRSQGTPRSSSTNRDDEIVSEVQSHSETPDLTDVDALAARQLHQEAQSATARKRPKQAEGQKKNSQSTSTIKQDTRPPDPPPPRSISSSPVPPPAPPPPPPAELELDKPFTSFFSKPHLRELAMSKNRKKCTRLAFGHSIPEMEEREFELPSDILTPEAIASCHRKRRRMKRARKE